MLRRILLYLSGAGWARALVSRFFIARRVARRFIAGETLAEAIDTARELNAAGLCVTLDYLGESVTDADDTSAVVAMYCRLIEQINAGGLDASLSLKLTHLGLDISESLCFDNLRQILAAAQPHGISVNIDTESSAYVETTFRMYRQLRDEHGFDNVATVTQSMLRRTADDMRQFAAEGARIRLVKGAYLEPESVAYPDKRDVDAQFIAIMREFLAHTPPAYLDIATHDEQMIAAALEYIAAHNVPRDGYEFQMLYGIRTARHHQLAADGHRMRVYVPFGEAWYPYFMRRLAERPANLWFFVRSVFRA
ncbi:MAG: proline dehydrogenase [Anaerolineaceae bacterium]|nr:MAG: proline dehydrogenase [Anaerolineaceae bacterium]